MSGIKHSFTSAKADPADTTKVGPTDWNDEHVIGDGTLAIDASASVATFTTTSGGVFTLAAGTSATLDFSTNDAPSLNLTTSSGGTGGPKIIFNHNSASQAAADILAKLTFNGKNSTPATIEYGSIRMLCDSPTAGAVTGSMVLAVRSGTPLDALTLSSTVATFAKPIVVPSYTVVGVPSASPAAQIAYISNEAGGAVLAFSDGTNWRRVTDRVIVS